jgi:hypothetical protein
MITKCKTWTETAFKDLLLDATLLTMQWHRRLYNHDKSAETQFLKSSFLPLCYQLQMPHNCSPVNSPYWDRQIWQLYYKDIFAFADLSGMPIEHLPKSDAVIVYIVTWPFDLVLQNLWWMTTQINSSHDRKWRSWECKCLHRQFSYMATNWIEGKKSFCFSWNDMLSSHWNMVSFD